MKLRLFLALSVVCALVSFVPTGAQAVTNGQYDGNNHPYVVYLTDNFSSCSGVLLSPTVMLTAAHCFFDSSSPFLGLNTETGAPLVGVSFDPNLINTLHGPEKVWYIGSYYYDPQFVLQEKDLIGNQRGGLPGMDTHDIAVVIFTNIGCHVPSSTDTVSCGSIPPAASLGMYGALPSAGLVDTLAMGTPVDLVGFGVQNFVNGGGPCVGPCKKRPGDWATRFFATTTLIQSNNSMSDEFIKFHDNKGGTCYGDSGGPDLLGGTNMVIGINSLGGGEQCEATSYSYRVDTAEALNWITTTVATYGGSL